MSAEVTGTPPDAGAKHVLALLNARHLPTGRTGDRLGRALGMYAVGGDAAFDWFDYREA